MAEVTVSGVQETQRALSNFVKDVENAQSVNKDIGSIITKQASALAPIRSGDLSRSIRYEAENNKVVIYAGNERVEYAPIIEYGWQAGGREGKRFIGRAINDNMKTIVKKYEDEVNSGIKKYNLN
jgi:hypothetical protein